MTISKQELQDWVDSLDEDDAIAINDGGLTLVVVGEENIHLEVGGIPDSEPYK